MAAVEQVKIDDDEDGMRLDRWFKVHYPELTFGALQKLLRTGQVRVEGGRAKSDTRVQAGQMVRVPPNTGPKIDNRPMTAHTMKDHGDHSALTSMTLHEDAKVLILNKPAGIAVQGGSGINRHIDGMLESLRNKKGEKPRLVHRLDRDTSGVLVIAKTRGAATFLTKAFRERTTEKTYWALVKGVPRKSEARISTHLLREPTDDGDRMRVVPHGVEGSEHAITDYKVVARSGHVFSWLKLSPVTGRMHQLRIHCNYLDVPILGDPKYFTEDHNWNFPGGMQKKLHLHARTINVPHPDGGRLKVTAPLSPHMVQSWNLLGLDEADGDEE